MHRSQHHGCSCPQDTLLTSQQRPCAHLAWLVLFVCLPDTYSLLDASCFCCCCTQQDGRIDYAEFCAMMLQGNDDVLKASSTLKAGILGVKQPRVTS